MNIAKKLSKLVESKNINNLMQMINSSQYSKFSFNEKANLFKTFNEILNRTFNHKIFLYVNKKTTQDYEARCVNANMEESRLVINGIVKNPYQYLRDILFMHLSYTDIENYAAYQIGRVKYEENFTYDYPQLGVYNKWNIRFLAASNKFISKFLNDKSNEYQKEFLNDFDYIYTDEAIQQIQIGYDAFDNCLKRGVYKEIEEIFNTISKMLRKDKLTPQELAWLSLDDIALCYIYEDNMENQTNKAENHYKQFIECYFKEYSKYIDINIDEFGLSINGKEMSDDDIFIDLLLQAISKVENKYHLIDNIVNDEELKRFNKVIKKNYSKLDCYFYSRLDIMDRYLANKNLEIINYNKWTKIYRDDVRKSLFQDRRDPFTGLLDNTKFINTVEQYLLNKDRNNKPLYQIMRMLNEAYGQKFNLVIEENVQSNTSMGLADDECIYINSSEIGDKPAVLITLFHEYRHLIQHSESKNNTGIYNDKLYKFVKKENEKSVCDNNYGYADIERFGYVNDMFYKMQPTEYDAELFAEKFLKNILKRMNKNIKINYNLYISNNYRRCKFIDSEKLSLESYKNYLIINEIPQSIKEENDNYKDIVVKIKEIKSKDDAIKIIKEPFFMALGTKEKITIYKIIAKDVAYIDYNEKEKVVIINGDKFKSCNINDYQIIEKLIKLDIDKKITNGEIKLTNRNQAIYDELIKYRPYKIEEYNCFSPYAYHSCRDKYYRMITKQNKKESKRK